MIVARGSVHAWALDFTKGQAVLDTEYERVTKAGKFTIYRRVDG